MNRSQVVPLAVAILCIAAIGISSTTMESSLGTDPQEAVDPAYDRLPIGQDDALTVQEEVEGTGGDSGEESTNDSPGDRQSQSSADDPDESGSASGGSDGATDRGQSGGTGIGYGEVSLLDRLLALLMMLLRILVALLVVASLVGLVVRYRERIVRVLGALVGSPSGESDSEDTVETWPRTEPSNAVERAWVALVQRVDPERPAVTTPSECASLARERGVDTDAADAITAAFERVYYGGVPADEEADRAEEGLHRLRNEASPHRTDGGGRRDEGVSG